MISIFSNLNPVLVALSGCCLESAHVNGLCDGHFAIFSKGQPNA